MSDGAEYLGADLLVLQKARIDLKFEHRVRADITRCSPANRRNPGIGAMGDCSGRFLSFSTENFAYCDEAKGV